MMSLIKTDKIKIETDRLILRPLKVSDAADLFEFCKDPSTSRYSEWEPHECVEQSRSFIRYSRRDKNEDKLELCIEHRDTGRVIGTCGFTKLNVNIRTGEIGYCLAADVRGLGYAFEAIHALCAYGFERLKLGRIEARVIIENSPSCRLLERLGFGVDATLKKGAYIKGRVYDLYLFSITDDEFLERES